MAVIVNNPVPLTEHESSTFLIGSIIFLGFVVLLIYFGLPVKPVIIPGKIGMIVNQTK